MTRASSPRRRERPRRLVAAAALLLLSTLTVGLALLVGTPGALAAAAVVAVVLGWVAVRLGHDQVLDERRAHAGDRVAQARAFRALYLERSAEHAQFASQVRDRLLVSERVVSELRGTLRLAEVRGDEAEHRARHERARARLAEARVAELESELAGESAEIVDELAPWEVIPGVEADTVADLLSWETRSVVPLPRRRPA